MKGAHADLSSTAWQEIGVKPFFGLSGIHERRTPSSSVPRKFKGSRNEQDTRQLSLGQS
jgi:hypothetical protein